MKKVLIVALIILIFLFCMNAVSVRALHPDTPLFEEASFDSAVIFRIPQNAYVIPIEEPFTQDNTTWQKVQYGSYVGYADRLYLYEFDEDKSFSLRISRIKATSTKMGEDINIYSANSLGSAVVDSVKDGTRLQRVESTVDYGDFVEILYGGQRAFIQNVNATASLTYNEKTALIVGAAAVAVLTAMVFLINFILKSRKKKV
ncbi:MAG: hypothetical protein PHC84_06920 [Clostridia bacterium]|nr:hypothetical protein [Clostridia bacterium]